MKRSFYFGVILVFTVLFFAGCGKRNDMIWVYYDETNCADQWTPNHNNEMLKDNFVSYYDNRGIRIYDVEIFFDNAPENCSECLCKTGRRFKAKVKGKDLKELKADGFYQ